MNMVPFDTALSSSALSVPCPGSFLPSSTSRSGHSQTLLPSPDFATDGYGEYGYREWYDYHIFAAGCGKEDVKSQMSYDSESDLPYASLVRI
jgi:hypothetical protein